MFLVIVMAGRSAHSRSLCFGLFFARHRPWKSDQANCHQRGWRRGSGCATRAGGGRANRSALCRQRSHSLRVSVSCSRNSSETARKAAICASRTGVKSGFRPTSPFHPCRVGWTGKSPAVRRRQSGNRRCHLWWQTNGYLSGDWLHAASFWSWFTPKVSGGRSAPPARLQATVNESLRKSVNSEVSKPTRVSG